jgi:hypothetical protein
MKTLKSIKKVGYTKFEYVSFAGIGILLLTILVGFIA